MTMMTLEIRPFGAFRQIGDVFTIKVPRDCTAEDIKAALADALGDEHRDLVNDSVLANDNEILPAGYVLREPAPLSILPPVCGG